MSDFLMEKYVRERRESIFNKLGRSKRSWSPESSQGHRVAHNEQHHQGWAALVMFGPRDGPCNKPQWWSTRRHEGSVPRNIDKASYGNQVAINCGIAIDEHAQSENNT
jgi:hypothetical protein